MLLHLLLNVPRRRVLVQTVSVMLTCVSQLIGLRHAGMLARALMLLEFGESGCGTGTGTGTGGGSGGRLSALGRKLAFALEVFAFEFVVGLVTVRVVRLCSIIMRSQGKQLTA